MTATAVEKNSAEKIEKRAKSIAKRVSRVASDVVDQAAVGVEDGDVAPALFA